MFFAEINKLGDVFIKLLDGYAIILRLSAFKSTGHTSVWYLKLLNQENISSPSFFRNIKSDFFEIVSWNQLWNCVSKVRRDVGNQQQIKFVWHWTSLIPSYTTFVKFYTFENKKTPKLALSAVYSPSEEMWCCRPRFKGLYLNFHGKN